jgi:hypothetical protein
VGWGSGVPGEEKSQGCPREASGSGPASSLSGVGSTSQWCVLSPSKEQQAADAEALVLEACHRVALLYLILGGFAHSNFNFCWTWKMRQSVGGVIWILRIFSPQPQFSFLSLPSFNSRCFRETRSRGAWLSPSERKRNEQEAHFSWAGH